jgi:polygalacturonase
MASSSPFSCAFFYALCTLVILQYHQQPVLVSSETTPTSSHFWVDQDLNEDTNWDPELLLPTEASLSSRSEGQIDEGTQKFWFKDEDEVGKRIVCSVSEFGAIGNGVGFDTVAIQGAIDACASHHGIVQFPPGRYLTATILLRSNITLQIDPGATILGSPNQQDYPPESDRWFVILAEDAENVEVTGGGIIDGQGLEFVTRFDSIKNVMVSWNATGDCLGDECRPRLIGFVNCKNVHIWNVYLHEPAYWW